MANTKTAVLVNVIFNLITQKVESIYMKKEDAMDAAREIIMDAYDCDPDIKEIDGMTYFCLGNEGILFIAEKAIIKEISERSGFGILLEL